MDDTAVAGEYSGDSDQSLASDVGTSLAGIALGAAILLLSGDVLADETVAVVGVGVAAIAVTAFLARRQEVVGRKGAAPLAAAASLATAVVGGYALLRGGTGSELLFGLSALTVGVVGTLVGGTGGVLAALADWRAVPDDRLASMAWTTLSSTTVGLVGYLALNVATLLLALLFLFTVWPELTPMRQQLIGALGLGLGTGVTAFAYIEVTDRGREFLDVRVPGLRDVGWTVLGLVVIFGGLIALTQIYQLFDVPSSSHSTVEQARQGNPEILLLLIPASFLIIGPGEELLFRNIVQKSLYDAFPKWGAVVVASAVFAVVHFPAYSGSGGSVLGTLGSLGTIFTLSIVLGAFYAKTENVVVPALIHGALNAIQFASLYVQLTGYAAAFTAVPV